MSNPLGSIKEKVARYIHLRIEEFRLEVIEKIVNIMGYFAFVIIAAFFSFLGVIFVGFGLAEWLSALFASRVAGYFATAGIFLFVSILTFASSKLIVRYFAGKMAAILTKKSRKKRKLRDDDD